VLIDTLEGGFNPFRRLGAAFDRLRQYSSPDSSSQPRPLSFFSLIPRNTFSAVMGRS
jgi:hypothetical protein